MEERSKMIKIPPESNLIEWKKSIGKGILETIVAMSNSGGGKILIGIEEIKDKNGNKKAKVVGHRLTAERKIKIQNYAESCMPKIDLNVTQLKISSKPVVEIEIPEGRDIPYCTGGGRYLIREDGKNKPIDPSRMKRIFLEKESKEFFERFKKAAGELEHQLREMSERLSDKLGRIWDAAEGAESLSDEAFTQADVAATASEETLQEIENLKSEVNLISVKLNNIEKDLSPQVKTAHQVLEGINVLIWKSFGNIKKGVPSPQIFKIRQPIINFIQYRDTEALKQVKTLRKATPDSSVWNQKILVDGKPIKLGKLLDKLVKGGE